MGEISVARDYPLTLDRGCSLAVVEDGKLAENLSGRQNAQELSLAGDLDFAQAKAHSEADAAAASGGEAALPGPLAGGIR